MVPELYRKHLLRQGFQLERQIGSGLSGRVYVAQQSSLGRHVAVKFFDSSLVGNDQPLRTRFQREPRILAKLQHPNIPYVVTSGVIGSPDFGVPYTVLQYIAGETLSELIMRRSTISLEEKLGCLRQVLGALEAAHDKSVVHRDIKPENMMVVESGHCFLIDFSIGVSFSGDSGLTRATEIGTHLGTAAYMSPEQSVDMSTVDGRSDLFSLGVVALELFTGSTDRSRMQKLVKDLPRWIREFIERACSNGIEGRFQSANEFSRALGSLMPTYSSPALHPSVAFCSNMKCKDAKWSSRGYCKGPNIVADSTNSYCTSCGSQLKYQCEDCGSQFSMEPFCGSCGNEHFTVPTCESCGSLLEKEFIGTDTNLLGCGKCQRAGMKKALPSPDIDDDIPF